MVEDRKEYTPRFEFPPLPDDEPELQEFLDSVMVDVLLPGSNLLLEARVKTCRQRINSLPELQQRMLQASSAEELRSIVSEQKAIDERYRDGGVLKKSAEQFVQMQTAGTLGSYLERRQRKLL